MSIKYYFDNTNLLNKYPTLWRGHFKYNIDSTYIDINKLNILKDIINEITKINFYINIEENYIYISLCQDSLYYHHEFDKDIIKIINEIENYFNINIEEGEFHAIEVKHYASQYKYIISKNINNKITINKKIFNFDLIK